MSTNWSIFQDAVGFETGLPFAWLESLRSPELEALTRELIESEAAYAQARERFVGAVRREVETGAVGPSTLRWLSKARRKVRTDAELAPPPADVSAQLRVQIDALASARARMTRQHEDLNHRFRGAERLVGEKLLDLSRSEAFVDSILTTSPQLYDRLARLHATQRRDDVLDVKLARRLMFYLARGALKTHVASRLGTVLFPRFRRNGEARTQLASPAGDGISRRRVFLSYWAVERLARTVFAEPALFALANPRLSAAAELRGAHVYLHLAGTSRPLTQEESALLASVDGATSIESLASRHPGIDVAAVAAALESDCVLEMDYLPAATVFDPLEHLIERVASLPASPLVSERLAELERLRGLCRDYQCAALDKREGIAAELEARFAAIAGVAARRNHGLTYGDRRVFYEECLSDFEPSFGAEHTRELEAAVGPALEPCLAYGRILRRQYRRLAAVAFARIAQNGAAPFCDFVRQLQYMAHHRQIDLGDPVRAEFERAWSQRVHDCAARSDDGVARLSPEDLRPLWSLVPQCEVSGAHATVDLFIAAPSATDILGPDSSVVIGEVGENVMPWGSQYYFADDRGEIERRVAERMRSIDGYKKLAMIVPPRTHKGFFNESFGQAGVLIGGAAASTQRASELPLRELVVRDIDGDLAVCGADGVPLQLFHHHDELVHLWSFAAPRVLIPPVAPVAGRVPRIEIGRACLQRAQWHLCADDLFRGGETPAQTLKRLHLLRSALRVPERVFAHVATEPKPFYIDFGSASALSTVRYLAQRAPNIRLVEMLPQAERMWSRRDDGPRAIEMRVLMTRKGGGL